MACCGPKLSLFGIIISSWGIVQLGLMGFFFYINSVALFEDLAMDENEPIGKPSEFYHKVDSSYQSNAYNCWIAACLYILTLVLSTQQFFANSRSSLNV